MRIRAGEITNTNTTERARLHKAPRDWVRMASPSRPVAIPRATPLTGARSSGPAASHRRGQKPTRKRAPALLG